MNDEKLTHIDANGAVKMVDVGGKPVTLRKAVAYGEVRLQPHTLELIRQGLMKKGDVFTVAKVAGIMAAKKTAELIPLCHSIAISKVNIEIEINDEIPGVIIQSEVQTLSQTGVEMEALTSVSVAALTIYDMVKAVERSGQIQNIHLVEKHGGRSGDFYFAETG
jgi:cyclic pyranopterin monophosphate synthase